MTPFLTALAVAFTATPAAAALARALGALDRPVPGLKDHAGPTPYLGGLAVAAGLAAGLGAAFGGPPPGAAGTIARAALVVLLVGLVDDLRPMGPGPKFIALTAAATVLVAGGVHLDIKAFPIAADVALTYFWVLAATNAMNIVDVADGLAAGLGAIAGAAFAAVMLSTGDLPGAATALALAGACLGFLPWNARVGGRTARIFLGDAGALTLGAVLAAVAIQGAYTTFHNVGFLVPVVILGVPLFETFLVMTIRLLDGRSPFRGSRDHLAIRLGAAGLAPPAAVGVLWAAGAALGAIGVAITGAPLEVAFVLYSLVAMAALFAAVWAARVRV